MAVAPRYTLTFAGLQYKFKFKKRPRFPIGRVTELQQHGPQISPLFPLILRVLAVSTLFSKQNPGTDVSMAQTTCSPTKDGESSHIPETPT